MNNRIIPSINLVLKRYPLLSFKSLIHQTKQEKLIFDKLSESLNPKFLSVKDISDGCGSMFEIQIKSDNFKNLNLIKQHKLVNSILKSDIKNWHGLRLKTSI